MVHAFGYLRVSGLAQCDGEFINRTVSIGVNMRVSAR
jgi:hypothetical protein